jgi:hypothetical protein
MNVDVVLINDLYLMMDNKYNHKENDNDTLLNDDDQFHVYLMIDI